jgi:hypothetical protein
MMFPKFAYIRNKKHLKAVAALPCQLCFIEGQTQASHSNQSKHGKGRSIKASDEFTAALCQACHAEIDQGRTLTQTQRESMWDLAFERTKQLLNKRAI